MVEPFVFAVKSFARLLAAVLDTIAPRFPATTWFAAAGWLQREPDVADRVVDVFRRAAIWANSHRAESSAILVRYTKITPAALAVMTRSAYGTDLVAAELQPAINVGVKYGDIEHALAAATSCGRRRGNERWAHRRRRNPVQAQVRSL